MNKKRILFIATLLLSIMAVNAAGKVYKPWSNGRLVVSENNRYIVHENGQPFSGWATRHGCCPKD